MNCTKIQNELVAFVLDELNSADRASVERHLANGCSECILQLKEIRESIELLWQAVPNGSLTDDLQREILARAVAVAPEAETIQLVSGNLVSGNLASGKLAIGEKQVSWFSYLPIQSLVAFAAGLLISVAFHSLAGGPAEQLNTQAKRDRDSEVVSLASPKVASKLEMSERKRESTHLVSLRKRADSSELRGYVLWDSLASEVHLYCFGLQQLQTGWQYSLWLIGPSVEVRAVDRLDVDEHGNCQAVVHWPVGEFNFARVTIEPSSTMNSRPSENVELTSNAFPVFPR